MKDEWLIEEIESWDERIVWESTNLSKLTPQLKKVSEINKGIIIDDDADLNEDTKKTYMVDRLKQNLNVLSFLYLKNIIGTSLPEKYLIETSSFSPELENLVALTFDYKLNLNRATHQELVDLPGIGNVTASRIIKERQKKGTITNINELLDIKGISKKEFDKFSYMIFCGEKYKGLQFKSESLSKLAKRPSFENLVHFWYESNITVSRYHPVVPEDIQTHIINEITNFVEEVENSKHYLVNYKIGVPSSYVKNYVHQLNSLEEIERYAINDVYGSLIEDAEYSFFLLDLIKKSTINIYIIMFFMRYEDEKAYPTDDLFKELLNARNRGVEIKIIIDQDADGDAINSRTINEEAFKFFKKNNIEVKFDSVEKYTHSKIVIVDDKHVVIGSHNWTAGSFFTYDDTSVYIYSPDLFKYYYDLFSRLWETY